MVGVAAVEQFKVDGTGAEDAEVADNGCARRAG